MAYGRLLTAFSSIGKPDNGLTGPSYTLGEGEGSNDGDGDGEGDGDGVGDDDGDGETDTLGEGLSDGLAGLSFPRVSTNVNAKAMISTMGTIRRTIFKLPLPMN